MGKPCYILGVPAFYHDSAAALLLDGDIVAAAQEERFARKKGDPSFPNEAVKFCLERVGIGIDEVDFVGLYSSWRRSGKERRIELVDGGEGFVRNREAQPASIGCACGHARRRLRTRWDCEPPPRTSDANSELEEDSVRLLKELWAFMKVQKKWWLLPIIVVLLITGSLLVLAQGSALAPFMYTFF